MSMEKLSEAHTFVLSNSMFVHALVELQRLRLSTLVLPIRRLGTLIAILTMESPTGPGVLFLTTIKVGILGTGAILGHSSTPYVHV